MFKKIFTILIVVIFVIAIASMFLNDMNKDIKNIAVGDNVIDFELEDNKENVTSLSDFKGDIIILNFWASWCPPCVKEMPDLMSVQEKYKDKGVSVIAINRTKVEIHPRIAKEFLIEEGIDLIVLYDYEDDVSNLYNVTDIPHTFIIDQEFGLIRSIRGEVNKDMLSSEIEKLLGAN